MYMYLHAVTYGTVSHNSLRMSFVYVVPMCFICELCFTVYTSEAEKTILSYLRSHLFPWPASKYSIN